MVTDMVPLMTRVNTHEDRTTCESSGHHCGVVFVDPHHFQVAGVHVLLPTSDTLSMEICELRIYSSAGMGPFLAIFIRRDGRWAIPMVLLRSVCSLLRRRCIPSC